MKILRAHSRTDVALGTDPLLPYVTDVSYQARELSDHSPLVLSINLSQAFKRTSWRVNPFWLQEQDMV